MEKLRSELERTKSDLRDRNEEIEVLKVQIKYLKESLLNVEKEKDSLTKSSGDDSLQVEVIRKKKSNLKKKVIAASSTSNSTDSIDSLKAENEHVKQLLINQQLQFKAEREEMEKNHAEELEMLSKNNKNEKSTQAEISRLITDLEQTRRKLSALQEDLVRMNMEQEVNRETISRLTAEKKNLEKKIKAMEDLEKSVESMKQEIGVYHENQEILEKQLKEFGETKVFLEAEIKKLQEENSNLTIAMQELAKQVEDLTLKLNEKETAPVKQRSIRETVDDKSFQHKYGLPDTEFSITYFNCFSKNMKAGYLYLTPRYLIFDVYLNLFKDNSREIIPIDDIVSINKTKAGFLPGKGSDIEVRTKDGKVILFRNFMKRKEAIKNILQQASNISHKIIIMRNGSIDQRQ